MRLPGAAALLIALGMAAACAAAVLAPANAAVAGVVSAPARSLDASAVPALSGSEDSLADSRLGVSATAPSGRYLHTAILDSLRHRMLVFGGSTFATSDELWALSLEGAPAWQLVPGAMPSPARAAHVAILDPVRDRMVVFGGVDQNQSRQNDVWVFPLSQDGPWSQLAVAGTPPAPRSLHCAIYDPIRDRLIVFGGYKGTAYLNDVWALSLSGTPTWIQIFPSGAAPSPRCECSAVYDAVRDRMIVTGGVGNGFYFNDTWALSLGGSPQWTQLDAGTGGPSPRSGLSSIFDPARDLIWLFGGRDLNHLFRDDLWTLSLSGTPTWTRLVPNGTVPSGRAYHSAILAPSSDRMVVFSGLNANLLSDTWVLQLGSATWYPLASAPQVPPTEPSPRFTDPVAPSASTIVLGQTFSLSVRALNGGLASDDGRISVSFPALTDPADGQWVEGTTSGDPAGIVELPAGAPLVSPNCQPLTASCLAVEYRDNDWLGLGQETHDLTMTVRPQVAGTFYFYVRATMHQPATTCTYVNALPAQGDPHFTDQQGWKVSRFAVTVVDAPQPTIGAQVSATTIEFGQSFTVAAAVTNYGATSDDGRIAVSFPTLTSPSDSAQVSGPLAFEYLKHPAGSPLLDASCQPVTASCLVVEYQDSDWLGLGQESHQLTLTVQPQAPGTFYFYLRATMHKPVTRCTYVNAVPPGGEGGYTDQQGFPVARYAVAVTLPPPIPQFSMPLDIPPTITLGQSFTLAISVRNEGGSSDDGRIVVSFPVFNHPGDAQWVASQSAGDAPGYAERPAGSGLQRANCQATVGGYLVAEYDDNNWLGEGVETNDLMLTVTPQAAGTFYVDVRATMHQWGAGCSYVNDVPDGGAPAIDQQDWGATRFEVQVLVPVSPPTTTWSRITPPAGGPGPRFSTSVVYHPGRDALVFYGGANGTYSYLTDSWVLPLAPGESWTQLVPGGPVPYSRYNQSMILNPVEDNLVIFGGYHDVPLNDLTTLALSPLVWWFPATPSGPQPSPRSGPSAVYDPLRHRMLVIGGFGSGYLNDVWEYRLPGNGTWTELHPAGTPMPARTLSAAVYDPVRDRVLVFGGEGGPFLNDVWELTLGGTLAWNELHPTGSLPERRRQHTMIYDLARDRLLVFGGFYVNRQNDVWALSLGDSPAWTQLSSSTPPPSPRKGHAAVFDPIRDRMVVFGGDVGTNQFSNELWALNFDIPTPTQVSFGGAEVSAERVRLTWNAADASALQADVERNTGAASEWTVLGSASLEGDHLVFEDRDVTAGTRYGYRLVERAPDPGTVLDEQWVTVPPRAVLALAGASPNPAPDDLWVSFSLPAEGRATLELFDLKGRMLAQREVGNLGPGEHRIVLSESRLSAGVYLVRLTRADRVLNAKACVIR